MATEAAVAKRRAEAEDAINDCVFALAQTHGVEVAVSPVTGVRDLDLRRVMQLEAVADALKKIVAGSSAAENRDGEVFDDTKDELMRHTKAELREKAHEAGVETLETMTKAKIADLILSSK